MREGKYFIGFSHPCECKDVEVLDCTTEEAQIRCVKQFHEWLKSGAILTVKGVSNDMGTPGDTLCSLSMHTGKWEEA